jgi:hypothetical protein
VLSDPDERGLRAPVRTDDAHCERLTDPRDSSGAGHQAQHRLVRHVHLDDPRPASPASEATAQAGSIVRELEDHEIDDSERGSDVGDRRCG